MGLFSICFTRSSVNALSHYAYVNILSDEAFNWRQLLVNR